MIRRRGWTYDIAVSEGSAFHVREAIAILDVRQIFGETRSATHDGILPAPNAYTPWPDKQIASTTSRISRIVKLDGMVV